MDQIFRPAFLFYLAIVIIFLAIPCHVHAASLNLLEKMPKNYNGENSILLQSRDDTRYTDLKPLTDLGDYWFGTPDTYKAKPVITRGIFPHNEHYDQLAIYAWPSAVIQTGFKADTIIRVTVPGTGGFLRISGQGALDGQGSASHYRFYIYKGEDQYRKPLWEAVGGGRFTVDVNYSANDQIFFAVEALDSDDELKPKWKNLTLETYTDQASIPPADTPTPSIFPIPDKGIYGPGNLPQLLTVVGVIIIFLCGLFGFFIIKIRKDSGVKKVAPERPDVSLPKKAPGHHDVFISYSKTDKPVSDAICAYLEAEGIRCWVAPRDVLPGEDFPDAIVRAIEQSRVMVLIVSSSSNNSPHVLRELTKAVNNGLVIIPFRIEDVHLSKSMEYLIGLTHWLDAMTPPLEQHIEKLVQTVKLILMSPEK